jgi:hypothetical protein
MAKFVHFRRHIGTPIFGYGLFHTRRGSAPNGQKGWFPLATDVEQGTIYLPSVPASGDYSIQVQTDTLSGGLSGTEVQLTGNGVLQSVRGTLGASLPAASVGAVSESRFMRGEAASSIDRLAGISYECDAPNAGVGWLCAGDEAFNIVVAATDRFYSFGWAGVSATVTESGAQIIIPTDGILQFFQARYVIGAGGSDVRVIVRVNGVNTALDMTCLNAANIKSDLTTQVSVTAGQKVGIRFFRTGGTSTSFPCNFMLGFVRTEQA